MKPNQTRSTKLSLNKTSIAKLNDAQKQAVAGGEAGTPPPTNATTYTFKPPACYVDTIVVG